jgi:L-ribulose-5-phosphate 3-epimerase
MSFSSRRDFVKVVPAAAALTLLPRTYSAPVSQPSPAGRRRALKKGFLIRSFAKAAPGLKLVDKFKLIKAAGFEGVEVTGSMNQSEILAARDTTGLQIPSVVVATHWNKPLSDPNPEARRVGLEGLLQALRDAKIYGASSVLLVPGVVTKEVSYAQAHERSIAEIRKAIPLAESLGVTIAIENVWNRFLLSPLEAARYADAFGSPMVKWHFDVGNVPNTGWPEHWIRTLGPRIVQVHIKEFSRAKRDKQGPLAGFEVDLFDGDNDWPTVMAAFDEIGYQGWMIAEQFRPDGFDDAAWLVHLSAQMDRVFMS